MIFRTLFRIWGLEFGIYLEFEIWDLYDLIPTSSVYLNLTEFCKLHL
jgi:hypothetical protein